MLSLQGEKIFPNNQSFLFALASVIIGIALGIATIFIGNPTLTIVFALASIIIVVTLARPEIGLVLLTTMTFTRFSDILVGIHNLPSTFQPFLILLAISTGLYYIRARRRPTGLQPLIVSLLLYGVVVFFSLAYAKNTTLADLGLQNFAKDAFIAILVVLLVQNANVLRMLIWGLLAVAIVLSSLSVYQYFTGTFTDNYWGFAQTRLSTLSGEGGYRLGGPFEDSPFYGQILLVFVPLALNRLIHEKKLWLQVLAGWALAASILVITLTFSRGAFLGLVVMAAVYVIRRPPRPIAFVMGVILIGAALTFTPANYLDRIGTITEFAPIFGQSDIRNEASFRGRASENIVAIQMFLDHPILGVGVGNYNDRYVEYSSRLGIDPRLEDRSAHSLYLEILAESGIVGSVVFVGILYAAFKSLHRARRVLKSANLHDIAEMIQAVSVGLIGYLTAGLFLHLAFARPFWLLIGLAFAATQVAKNVFTPNEPMDEIFAGG